jgi:chemotaxis protein methyltransferase CheR
MSIAAGEEYRHIADLVYERTRICLHQKPTLIQTRVAKRLRALGMETLRDYCRYLQGPDGLRELPHLIDLLTTNYTHFLRESPHFEFLVQTALPGLLKKGARSFNAWSAACATGEEPFTLAVFLAEHFPLDRFDWRILATDISQRALQVGREAVYPAERIATLPEVWQRKYFQVGSGAYAGQVRVKQAIRERVVFEHQNLLAPPPNGRTFEIIFCRNVMIYFDRGTQTELVNTLSRFLAPGGYLFVGHAESLTGIDMPLTRVSASVYQKA